METLRTAGSSRIEKYETLVPQLEALAQAERDTIARMANFASAIHETFGWLWTGFYRVKVDRLVLGPFQGSMACTSIGYGRGVCGTAWREGRTLIVPDVNQFAGHIACSSLSRSEIVVPVHDADGSVTAVLDIDSASEGEFSWVDAKYLERVVRLL